MILLLNVRFEVWRSPASASSGTGPAEPHLHNVKGHITRMKDSPMTPMPNSALKAIYEVYVEPSTDIREGDIIKNIIRLDNNREWFPILGQETWRVLDANNSSPGFLEYRDVKIGRFVGAGPYV